MDNTSNGNHSQIIYLKDRLNMFLETIDSLDPKETKLEDIDRLIQMIDEIEDKCEQIKDHK
ncbi:SE1561 family protein [Cytobacillus sp. IB215665]|uniref:SE1561 family protein n=1 Tax=Cytobacillus sp. IB215665 TaxID=3097357 RepID=UPI002A0D8174|nr:SE1561 family protein [Cytobacillus sp. IB215665]MDX8365318.1 SE1561 family protein [Cytobacillus sp. IB215665]